MALTVADIALIVGVLGAFLIALIAGCMIFVFCCGGFGRGGNACCPEQEQQRSSLNIAVIKRQEPNRRKIHVVPATMPFFPGGPPMAPGMIGPPAMPMMPGPPEPPMDPGFPPPPPPPPPPPAPQPAGPAPVRRPPPGRKIPRGVAEERGDWGRDFNFKKDADSSGLMKSQVLPNL